MPLQKKGLPSVIYQNHFINVLYLAWVGLMRIINKLKLTLLSPLRSIASLFLQQKFLYQNLQF